MGVQVPQQLLQYFMGLIVPPGRIAALWAAIPMFMPQILTVFNDIWKKMCSRDAIIMLENAGRNHNVKL